MGQSKADKTEFFYTPEVLIPTTVSFLAGLVCLGMVFISNDYVRQVCKGGGYSSECWIGVLIVGLCLVLGSITYANAIVYLKKKKLIRKLREEDRQEKLQIASENAIKGELKEEKIAEKSTIEVSIRDRLSYTPHASPVGTHSCRKSRRDQSVFFTCSSNVSRYQDLIHYECEELDRYRRPSIEVDNPDDVQNIDMSYERNKVYDKCLTEHLGPGWCYKGSARGSTSAWYETDVEVHGTSKAALSDACRKIIPSLQRNRGRTTHSLDLQKVPELRFVDEYVPGDGKEMELEKQDSHLGKRRQGQGLKGSAVLPCSGSYFLTLTNEPYNCVSVVADVCSNGVVLGRLYDWDWIRLL